MNSLNYTDFMYIIASIILISIVLTAKIADKWKLPLVLIALAFGIIFGSDITGLVYFDNAILAKQIADFGLMFVLFIGGFGTKKEILKNVLRPSLTLASLGVIITAVITGVCLNFFLGFNLAHALLLGCVISSTDAAAVFSILRTRSLSGQIASITEIESATNDPMAIILTTTAIQLIGANLQNPLNIGLAVLWQFIGGILIGLIIGKMGSFLLKKIENIDKGYFYILVIGIVFLSFGIADLIKASGMLSAFFAGFIMGNSSIPYKRGITTFLDALSTISNVAIFVLLGLLVFPREFGSIWFQGLIVFIILTFLSRPIAVFICTSLSKFSFKEKLFLSWSGLRGAVPIVLATYPVAAGVEQARIIFNIVFFAVALSILIQGSTISKIADLLKLTIKTKSKPNQVMELVTFHTNELELCELSIDDDIYEGSATIQSIHLPEGTTISMINRNEKIIAPRGSTIIYPGDVLFILVRVDNEEKVTTEILKHFLLKNGSA